MRLFFNFPRDYNDLARIMRWQRFYLAMADDAKMIVPCFVVQAQEMRGTWAEIQATTPELGGGWKSEREC